MPEQLSFTDIIGIAGFIWSLISFYIGYLWYQDGSRKDALIAKLTADNELLRQEIKVIGSTDGGVRREVIVHQRTADRQTLDRMNLFYRAAFRVSRTRQDADAKHGLIFIALSVIVVLLVIFATNIPGEAVLVSSCFILFCMWLPVKLILYPFVFSTVEKSRLADVRRLFDQHSFSFQDVLAAKSWLDQQEWDAGNMQRQLALLIEDHLSHLDRLGDNKIGEAAAVSAAAVQTTTPTVDVRPAQLAPDALRSKPI
jgi:hypothetical protein